MHQPQPKVGLPAIGIFADLDAAQRETLAGELETRALKRGEVLMRQGDLADALYVVLTGRFAVTREGRRDVVTEIGPDQPVGEIGFLTGGERTATVTAMRDSLVLRLGRTEFERLAATSPSIWRTLTSSLAQRLAATTASEPSAPDPRPRTVAIIRAGAEADSARVSHGVRPRCSARLRKRSLSIQPSSPRCCPRAWRSTAWKRRRR